MAALFTDMRLTPRPTCILAILTILSTACTPFPLTRRIAAAHPECLFYVNTSAKQIALTIDDGPDERTTPLVLDLLREHDSRATFFMISDRVSGNDSLVVRTLRERHEIGNHMSRNEASVSLAPTEYERSLLAADTVLRKYTSPKWTRPGSGFYNARMIATMRKHNYRCALGSVYPFDPQIPIATYASATILREVRQGAVIILHDGGYKGRNTVKVLARILPELRRRGYSIVTLSELVQNSTQIH